MTKKELQAQINFLVSELERLRNGYEYMKKMKERIKPKLNEQLSLF